MFLIWKSRFIMVIDGMYLWYLDIVLGIFVARQCNYFSCFKKRNKKVKHKINFIFDLCGVVEYRV